MLYFKHISLTNLLASVVSLEDTFALTCAENEFNVNTVSRNTHCRSLTSRDKANCSAGCHKRNPAYGRAAMEPVRTEVVVRLHVAAAVVAPHLHGGLVK